MQCSTWMSTIQRSAVTKSGHGRNGYVRRHGHLTREALTPPQQTTQNLLGRNGQPEDVAKLVSWLVSDEAAFVTGTSGALVVVVIWLITFRFAPGQSVSLVLSPCESSTSNNSAHSTSSTGACASTEEACRKKQYLISVILCFRVRAVKRDNETSPSGVPGERSRSVPRDVPALARRLRTSCCGSCAACTRSASRAAFRCTTSCGWRDPLGHHLNLGHLPLYLGISTRAVFAFCSFCTFARLLCALHHQ